MRTILLPTLSALLLTATLPADLSAAVPVEQKLEVASEVYRELLAMPDREVPERLLADAVCVAVIPNVIKGAFGWGGRHGRGVMSCRGGEGWSPPIFVKVTGVSFGFQVGAQATDVVLFFMSDRGVRSLLDSRFTLGADASVAAGPVGRSAEASTDVKLQAEIYSYARSRGLFAGISLEGAHLRAHPKSTQQLYGERLWPDDVLFEHAVPEMPVAAQGFVDALEAGD